MYLLLGILVALGSIFVPTLIGALIAREHLSKTIMTGIVASILYAIIVWLFSWGIRADIYGPSPLFGWVIIGAIISMVIIGNTEESLGAFVPGFLIALVGVVWVIAVSISGSNFSKSVQKAKLFDVKTEKINSKIMDLADPAHICLVDENMARSKAEKALSQVKTEDNANAGSIFVLGSGTKQFVDGQLWWIFPLDFDGYWQWSRFPNSPAYIRASAEDPMAEADAVQYNKQGEKIQIKYLNSASFDILTERYLRKNGFLYSKIGDFTFEVDDDWNPYYTISQTEWTIGYGGDIVTHTIVFNVQTGDFDRCPIEDVPSKYPWIDRANDISVISYQAEKWGMYSEAAWAWTSRYDGQRKIMTPGWYVIYDQGKCYHFTGWTSYSSSSDLIGISLTDANTGETVYYPTQGSTENVAYEIAKGHWSNFDGYTPTELVPYNIYGMLTYVMPIAYNQTQFMGVSLVSIINKDINASGKTLEEALSNYRSSMSNVGSTRGVPYEGQPKQLTITAIVDEVGMPFVQGEKQMYPFTLEGIDKIFQINYSLQNAKVSFLKPGKQVEIVYIDTKEEVVSCMRFDIPSITLSNENPAQARWVENQKNVKKEESRIDNIQENSDILETENLGDIHPDSLRKFIEAQKKIPEK